jgi:DNA-binding NtrC family response regulator
MAESLWRRVLFQGHTSKIGMVPQILAITAIADDATFYENLALPDGWRTVVAGSVPDALALLAKPFPIVICDRDVAGSAWREVLDQIAKASPDSCLLLASRVSDEYLWREVVMHGGYDILSRPLEEAAVLQSLKRAWHFWRAEHPKPAA